MSSRRSRETPEPRRQPAFRCEVSRERTTARIQAVGELDLATVPILDAELAGLRDAGFPHLILDLAGLDFIDSTGLHCILRYDAEARQDGYSIALIPGPPPVQRRVPSHRDRGPPAVHPSLTARTTRGIPSRG